MINFLKRTFKDINPIAALFVLPFLLVFVLYFGVFTNSEHIEGDLRSDTTYHIIDQSYYDISTIESDGPLGYKKVYSFKMDGFEDGDILTIYNIHNFVQIYADDVLVYDFSPKDNNQLTKSLGTNWVSLTLMEKDRGKDFRIEVTPVYQDVANLPLEVRVGPAKVIYSDVYTNDSGIMILSVLSWTLGVLFIIVTLISFFKMQVVNMNVLYLGVLAILFGLWKGLDLAAAPLLFRLNPQLISFLSVASLALLPVPISFFILEEMRLHENALIRISAYLISLISTVMGLVQLFTRIDLREHLVLIHLLLLWCVILAVGSSIVIVVKEKRVNSPIVIGTFFIGLGGIIDMIIYRFTSRSDFSVVSFIVFVILMLVEGLRLITASGKSSMLDLKTGLFNRAYCDKYIDSHNITKGTEAIIFFDLNGLKEVNDKYGHEEGDIYISNFTNTIKKISTTKNIVGRLGGDEFVIILEKTSVSEVDSIIKEIRTSIDQVNLKTKIKVSYATGVAYAKNNEKMRDLLKLADERMYQDKASMKNKKYH